MGMNTESTEGLFAAGRGVSAGEGSRGWFAAGFLGRWAGFGRLGRRRDEEEEGVEMDVLGWEGRRVWAERTLGGGLDGEAAQKRVRKMLFWGLLVVLGMIVGAGIVAGVLARVWRE